MQEVWVEVEGFPDYEVSNTGFVRHCERRYRTLNGGTTPKGYKFVSLRKDLKSHTRTVHVLVANAFVPKPIDEAVYEVNHRNGDKTNNSYLNLEWMTHADNLRHARETGLVKIYKVRIIETGEVFESAAECADYLGVHRSYVYGHLNGYFPTCRGYQLSRV